MDGACLEGVADGLAGGRVPQPDRAVTVGAGQYLAVGLNATPFTPLPLCACLEGGPDGRPVTGFHSRTVPSPSALASILPSGLNATPFTSFRGRGRGAARGPGGR